MACFPAWGRPFSFRKGKSVNIEKAKTMSYVVNTVILFLVFGLMFFFYILDAPFLTYFSIPTVCVYLVGYFLIAKGRLDVYVWMVYIWLTIYMGITTVFLGYGYGFHLYCFSMIPVMFVTEYLAYKLEQKSLKALYVSVCIGIFYLLCTGYVAYFGPVYVREQEMAAFFWIFNALIVFGFLIFYADYMIKMVISSEEKLREMAQVDHLTKLFNRHYMMERLEGAPKAVGKGFLAMADIDNFKKINDKYGHAAGDEVLKVTAERMKKECAGCEVARWGGEEFLIFSDKQEDGKELMESLRLKVQEEPISWEKEEISVTITVGVAVRKDGQNMDQWIQDADEKLYYGKNHGKNAVIS